MDLSSIRREQSPRALGQAMHELMAELFPLCRSITGTGLRDTLDLIGKVAPLELTEVKSGTQVFDWTVPKEWRVHDAWVAFASDGTPGPTWPPHEPRGATMVLDERPAVVADMLGAERALWGLPISRR